MLYPASDLFVKLPAGPALVERSSSPCTQVCSGTMIGNVSLYCPVAILIKLLGLYLAGTLANAAAICGAVTAAARAVIASVITSTNSAAVVYAPSSAVRSALKYCVTLAVELSPFRFC